MMTWHYGHWYNNLLFSGGHSNSLSLLGNLSCSVNDAKDCQRCIIIQKDEQGYGLTVTGQSPVYVQEIKISKFILRGILF